MNGNICKFSNPIQMVVTLFYLSTKSYMFGIKMKKTSTCFLWYAFNWPDMKRFWRNWTFRSVQEWNFFFFFVSVLSSLTALIILLILYFVFFSKITSWRNWDILCCGWFPGARVLYSRRCKCIHPNSKCSICKYKT